MTPKEQRVWRHILTHRRDTPAETAYACGVELDFVLALLARIGTPEEVWRGADNGAGEWNAAPDDVADEEILAVSLESREKNMDWTEAHMQGDEEARELQTRTGALRDELRATPAVAKYPDNNPKTRYGEAKPKLSNVPTGPMFAMGSVFDLGAAKYGKFNWRRKVVSATVYYDAALRHLMAWYGGEALDTESGQSHLAHVMACMAILLDAECHGNLNDNRCPEGEA